MTDHLLVRLEALVLVAIGGFAGANLRFFVDGFAPGLAGTLVVNVAGSTALGFLLYEALYADLLAGRTRTHYVLGTGFLSSFTTYSTFAVETLRAPGWWPAVNLAATYGLGVAGVLAGRALAAAIGSGEAGGEGA